MEKKLQNPPESPSVDMVDTKNSNNTLECIICAEKIDGVARLRSLNMCSHSEPICSLCFLRIRALQRNYDCPSCKTRLEHIICTSDPAATFQSFMIWGESIGENYIYDSKSQIFFEKDYSMKVVSKLWQYSCVVCGQTKRDFKSLKSHYFGDHQMHLCALCHEFKQCFPSELQSYTHQSYDKHIRFGNNDGSKGHPNCEFCKKRFYDSHALFIHLSRDHYTCHICDNLGVKFKYYDTYQHLEEHFRKAHFLCEEPMCLDRKFMVFKNEIDLAAHNRQYHPHLSFNRAIPIRFTYESASEQKRPQESSRGKEDSKGQQENADNLPRTSRFEGGLGGRAHDGEWQVEIQSVATDPRDPNRHANRNFPAENGPSLTSAATEEFPELISSSANSSALLNKWSSLRENGVNQMDRNKAAKDFPSLPTSKKKKSAVSSSKNGAGMHQSTSASSLSSWASDSANTSSKSDKNKSSTNNGKKLSSREVEEEPLWNSTGFTVNESYEYDLAEALKASLEQMDYSGESIKASSVKDTAAPSISKKSNDPEEEFPSLQQQKNPASPNTNELMKAFKTSAKPKKPAMSSDLAAIFKSAGVDTSAKKKKGGSGITLVKTLQNPPTVPSSAMHDESLPTPPPVVRSQISQPSVTSSTSNVHRKSEASVPKHAGSWATIGGADKGRKVDSPVVRVDESEYPSLGGKR